MSPSTIVRELIHTVALPTMENHLGFIAYLKFAHGIMRASGPLLELAAQKSEGALRDYYLAHLGEEREHADWLAADLAFLGERPVQLDAAVATTAGAQFYYLHHVSPYPLLGYIAALEFRPMPLAQVSELEKIYGAAGLRTVRYHATHDPAHARELAGVIDAHPQHLDLISYSAFTTVKLLAFYMEKRIREALKSGA